MKNIEGGLSRSMEEEQLAADTYRVRQDEARQAGDRKTVDVYEHVIKEEMEHKKEFGERRQELISGISSKVVNPKDSLRELRIKLIQLKTDIEKEVPELEALYRESIEAAVAHARQCNLKEAIETYTFAEGHGRRIEKRAEPSIGRIMEIESLAREALVEALVENCRCKLK